MASIPTLLFRGAAATSSTTLYTVPGSTTTIVTDIVIANTDTSAHAATISLNGTVVVPAVNVPANTVVIIGMKQVVATGQLIAGFATSTNVNLSISGVNQT